jgi:radical SAM superfamily enzyme YgiQ (UPF0313 family)
LNKIKKIVLIEVKSHHIHLFSSAKLPRIGLPIISTILKNAGYNVKAYAEDLEAVDFNEIADADIVGISSITSTATRAYDLLKEIKKFKKDIVTVTGGPHPTFCPDESLENGFDYAVRGEGEKTIIELLDAINNETDLHQINGLSFKDNGNIIHNEDRKAIDDLDAIPYPDWTLIEGFEKINYIPLQTSRGCPYGCKFCSVIKMFGRKYRYRSASNVVGEIKNLIEMFKNTKAKRLFFYDDNFSSNIKRTKDILREIIDSEIDMPTWFAQERLEISKDEELLGLMKQTGCKRLMIGVESTNPKTLIEYKKKQTVSDISTSVAKFHEYGIGIHGMFVLGGENDDIDSIKETMKFIMDNRIDTVQLMVLTPFPGTETYDELKAQNRIFLEGPEHWHLYDGHHVVFQPNRIAPWDLQSKASLEVLSNVYSFYRALKWAFEKQIINAAIVIKSNQMQRQWAKRNKEYLKIIKNQKMPAYAGAH